MEGFFEELKAQGLSGVDLVVSDAHDGLVKAIKETFHGAMWQRCQAHFQRDVLDRVPKSQRRDIRSLLTDLYNSPGLEEAYERREVLLKRLDQVSPKAVRVLDEGFADVCTVLSLPEGYRKRLRTSNSIERLNEEIRRRERVIRIFPNEASLERLIGSLLREQHEKWLSGKVYFDMTSDRFEKSQARMAAQVIERRQKRKVAGGNEAKEA